MLRNILMVSALGLSIAAAPALAQQVSAATTGAMTSTETGVAPLSGVSATDYVKLAADFDLYEIQSSQIALRKSKRDDIKNYAREMIADHTATSKALMAALTNDDRKIARPSTRVSAENKAKLTLLKKAPRASFDDLYLQQQAQAHQNAWALHKAYATDGTDVALKQVASTAVPVIERHLSHAKGMLPATLSGQ